MVESMHRSMLSIEPMCDIIGSYSKDWLGRYRQLEYPSHVILQGTNYNLLAVSLLSMNRSLLAVGHAQIIMATTTSHKPIKVLRT